MSNQITPTQKTSVSKTKKEGQPKSLEKSTAVFPNIFTSLSFCSTKVKTELGIDNLELNRILAVCTRINVHVLLGLKTKILAQDTFKKYMSQDDHPYFVVIKAIVVSLMLGKSQTNTNIKNTLKQLKKVIDRHLSSITSINNQFLVTHEMINNAYKELRAIKSRCTKPSSALGMNKEMSQAVQEISAFMRELIREVRMMIGLTCFKD